MTRAVDEIRRRLEARKEVMGACSGLTRFLVNKGVIRPLAEEIAVEFFQEGSHVPQLFENLIRRLRTAAPPMPPFALTLVGPTGVGKTTTLLKLASLYIAQDLRLSIVNLTSNLLLESIAKQWGIPCTTHFEERSDVDVLLIDTPGCNFYLPQRVEDLGELVETLPKSEVLLTLSAATKDVDIYGAIHQFSSLGLDGLVFTKLDETLAGGILLNVCQKTALPLRYIAYGYPLPGKIEIADPKSIAMKILTDLNCQEFNRIRQLIIE